MRLIPQWLCNAIGFWLMPESEQLSEMEGIATYYASENAKQRSIINGLNDSVGHLSDKEKATRESSTILLGAILAANGGTLRIDGNVLDTITEHREYVVELDEPDETGSRTLRLVKAEEAVDKPESLSDDELPLDENFMEFTDGEYHGDDETGEFAAAL